jgi:hypothetical protein
MFASTKRTIEYKALDCQSGTLIVDQFGDLFLGRLEVPTMQFVGARITFSGKAIATKPSDKINTCSTVLISHVRPDELSPAGGPYFVVPVSFNLYDDFR